MKFWTSQSTEKEKNDKKISWFCKVPSGRFRILTLLADLGFWTLVAKFELWTQVACFRYGTLVADFGFWILDTGDRSLTLAANGQFRIWHLWPILHFGH